MEDMPAYDMSAATAGDSPIESVGIGGFYDLLKSVDVGVMPYAILAVFIGASILIAKIMRENTIKIAVENDHKYRMAALNQSRDVLGAPLVEGLMKTEQQRKILKFPNKTRRFDVAE